MYCLNFKLEKFKSLTHYTQWLGYTPEFNKCNIALSIIKYKLTIPNR